MAGNYDYFANESSMDKDNRVDGHGLQHLHDQLKQLTTQNSQNRSIKRHATSHTQKDSESDDSIHLIEDKQNQFTTVNRRQGNQRRKIQRGDEQLDKNVNRNDESYNSYKQNRTNNYRIYRRTNTNKDEDDSFYRDKTNLEKHRKYEANEDNKNDCSIPVNNQSLTYATDMHLAPLRIKCNPTLSSRNSATKLVQEFFKRIENSFRKKYTDHNNAIGFDKWWIDAESDLLGLTRDLSLYVFLCDLRHYPQEIDSVKLTPILSLHLPPQNAIIIKFVSNDYTFIELEENLKKRYHSIYHVEEMNGTRRLHNRHIRMDIYDKAEYDSILNSGTITLGGLICEIDEYLPSPKVLICSKFNVLGHTKKVCQLDYERCRRCGGDRINGDHQHCSLMCHHCKGTHQANDYKCPVIHQFRREVIKQLREKTHLLPRHIQMFIPLDCRLQKSEKTLANRNINCYKKSVDSFTYNNSLQEWPMPEKTSSNKHSPDLNIQNLQNNLDSLKQNYQHEIEKITNKLHHKITSIHKSCLMMQTQTNTQKEIVDSATSIINDLTFNMNKNVINVIDNFIQLLNEFIPHDQTKTKLNVWQDEIKSQHQYICERQIAYNNHMQNLDKLWLKQSNNIVELLDSCLSTTQNDQ